MDTEQVRTFLAVVAHGSFLEAAARLHVTQSTVSARIQALETRLARAADAVGIARRGRLAGMDRGPDGLVLAALGERCAGVLPAAFTPYEEGEEG